MININTANAIVDTPEWRAAAGLPQPSSPFYDQKEEQLYLSWLRAASKHLKILDAVRGVAGNENGAECDSSDQEVYFHPLHCAASQGLTSAGRTLLRRCIGSGNREGDVINVPDAALGCTPLHWASVTNRLDFMLLLLEAGARVDSRDYAGRTPLYASAAFGAVDAVELLLERGAAVDSPDLRGLTPLHAAAAGNHLDVAEELLSAGACVRRRSSVGCTARHVAEKQGHGPMARLLAPAAREEQEGYLVSVRPEETIAEVGGGDPLYWLFSQLRMTVAGRGCGMQSAA